MRKTDKRKIPRKDRVYCYHIPYLIKKINYTDPDGEQSTADREVIWNKGEANEYVGWCTCSLQLVCPFRCNYVKGATYTPLKSCARECHDPQMKEAIEAFITLHPHLS